jgi:hypothetical protein
MLRSAARLAFACVLVTVAVPSAAEQRAVNAPVAPSQAVADAWAREAREAQEAEARRPSTRALKGLYGSYGVLQGLDMYSTIAARSNGAREVNPTMNLGYAQATALKAGMAATSLIAVRSLAKKNKKAAVVTMIVMNAVTAVVVANNVRVARRLK